MWQTSKACEKLLTRPDLSIASTRLRMPGNSSTGATELGSAAHGRMTQNVAAVNHRNVEDIHNA